MTESIGYVPLQVILSMDGISGQLNSQLAGPLVASGRQAGRDAGQAVASGLQQAQADVSRASAALASARDKEATAAGKVRTAEAALQELRDRGITSGARFVRAEEALAEAQRRAERATGATRSATQELTEARARAANATDEAAQSEGRFASMLSDLNSRIGPAVKQMAGLAAASAGVGGAMATAAEAIGREQSVDVLAAQLGATPAMAAQYGQVAGELYSQGLGESFGDVTNAVGAVQSALAGTFDDPKKDLQDFSKYALDFNKTFGVDTAESVQVVSQLIKNEFAANGEEAFDLLTTSFKRVPAAMRDELPAILNEYGTHFRGLGFSGEEAFALLVDYAGQGAWAVDKAGDALKEFTLLGSDMSKSSQDAYAAIGLDAQAMSTAVASGGQAAQDALQKTAQGLLGIQDPAELANTAIALFGTPVEDLAIDQIPAFLQALTGGSDSMAGFAGAANQMGDTVNDNAATALERVKREIQGGLIDGLTSAATWIDQNRTAAAAFAIALGVVGGALVTAKVAAMGYAVAQGVMAAASGAGAAALAGNTLALGAYTIATGVVRGATVAWSAVQWLLNAALSANPLGLIVVGIAALVAGIVLAYQKSETFRAIVTAAWEGIKVAALWTWDNVLKPVFGWIIGNYQKAWDAAKAAGEGIGAAWQWISDKATAAKDWIVDTFNSVIDFVTGLPGRVRSAAAGLWDALPDGFKNALNWLISKWNSFSLGFDFNIPVINQRVKFQIDTPDLPLLAGGGVAGRTAAGKLWGPGTGTSDSILGIGANGIPTARVSAGEGVVKESAMAAGGAELVAALNAGWVPPVELLRAMLPGLAGGGLVDVQNFAKGEVGDPYGFGATGPNAWDCSAIAGALWAVATGKEPNQRYFTTDSDFAAMGWRPGMGGPNDLSIGTNGLSGASGHMASTAGDLNVEASSGDGVEVGPSALGAADFAKQWHWPLGGDPGGALTPGGAPGGAGGASGAGASGPGGTGGSSGGSASGGGTRPPGTAVPVWVDNWPSNFGSPAAGTSTSVGGVATDPAAPAVGGAGVEQHYGAGQTLAATPEQAADPWGEWAKGATDGFHKYLEGNWKEMLDSALSVVGMGASGQGGGNTYNLIGPDPRQAAMAIERVQRRMTAAARRTGGFGR